MERKLTDDQKREILILDELEKHAGRAMIKEFINDSIKVREDVLLGRGLPNEDLDKIQYSRNTVLREELKILKTIADYTTNIKKSSGVYQSNPI